MPEDRAGSGAEREEQASPWSVSMAFVASRRAGFSLARSVVAAAF
ncbi:MAG TPA: hypothetical protein VLV28_02590 [Gaiellaceae bacterium]|nr:hypothetical protein [Gaiellaceae bacterium]